MERKELDPRTVSILGGYGKQKAIDYGSLAPPLSQSVAYPFESAEQAAWVFKTEFNYDKYGGLQGYIYARENNPTLDIFEQRIAMLEHDRKGYSYKFRDGRDFPARPCTS